MHYFNHVNITHLTILLSMLYQCLSISASLLLIQVLLYGHPEVIEYAISIFRFGFLLIVPYYVSPGHVDAIVLVANLHGRWSLRSVMENLPKPSQWCASACTAHNAHTAMGAGRWHCFMEIMKNPGWWSITKIIMATSGTWWEEGYGIFHGESALKDCYHEVRLQM